MEYELIISENEFLRLFDFICLKCEKVKEILTKNQKEMQEIWCDTCHGVTVHKKQVGAIRDSHRSEKQWEPVIYGGKHNTQKGYHVDPEKNKYERVTGKSLCNYKHERIAPMNYNSSNVKRSRKQLSE